MKIDSHQHFIAYNPVEYGWMQGGLEVLRRDFLPEHLEREIAAAGIDAVVSVQARQVLAETEALLGYARDHAFIAGVVGWLPLIAPELESMLERFAQNPKLRGLRHVLHDEPDPDYMLREDFNRGIRCLTRRGLAYDILIFEKHVPQTLSFVDRHPEQVFIIDHSAKPRIAAGELEPWASRLRDLARRENVFCKLSGMVTEADWATWTPEQLLPYAECVLEAFGPRRVLFGSDWPVCTVASTYRRWAETAQSFLASLSHDEQAQVWGGTAIRAYKLKTGNH